MCAECASRLTQKLAMLVELSGDALDVKIADSVEWKVRAEKAEAALLRATSDETVDRVLDVFGEPFEEGGENYTTACNGILLADARTRVAKALKGEE